MLIYFIHGVATRDASYANKLIKLIEEECKRKNLPIPYCHAGFWGNVLKGTEKLWRDIEQELQTKKQKNSNFNPEQSFRYQNFRKEYLSYFIGDAFSYLGSDRGKQIRRIIADQLIDLVQAYPQETELHIVAHSLGTVILWDLLFSERFDPKDPAHEIRDLIGKERGKLSLSSVTTMGSPIPFLNLTLGIDTNQIEKFITQHQGQRLLWNNLINSSDIIAYPIRPLFDSINDVSKILISDYYLEATSNIFDSVEIAAVVLNSLNAHTYYLASDKVAKNIVETIYFNQQDYNHGNSYSHNTCVALAIERIAKISGVTKDVVKMKPLKEKILLEGKFKDASGYIYLSSDLYRVHHVYIQDNHQNIVYAVYVGWIHVEGLKNSVTEIIRQLCYVNDEAKNS
jgi:hypothetical protein